MEKPPTPEQQALAQAIATVGGKTALMNKLNERDWRIGSHNTIAQWHENGVPAKYCPDIEDITGVRCEALCPATNWPVLRASKRLKSLSEAKAA